MARGESSMKKMSTDKKKALVYACVMAGLMALGTVAEMSCFKTLSQIGKVVFHVGRRWNARG
jgi:hypothetical protein